MEEDIKKKVLEFAAIAKECPENLQEKCFELLLSNYLSLLNPVKEAKREPFRIEDKDTGIVSLTGTGGESKQENIIEKDLHVKVKQFLKKTGITIEQINQIFYKENEDIKPLYDDLKTTKASESQIRIALLNSLRNAILTGDFQFNGEDVRKEVQLRKCFDAANYIKNYKTNKQFFDNFKTYDKSNPAINLSPDGKEKLAEIIKDLQ